MATRKLENETKPAVPNVPGARRLLRKAGL
jgi:hypothetical protein